MRRAVGPSSSSKYCSSCAACSFGYSHSRPCELKWRRMDLNLKCQNYHVALVMQWNYYPEPMTVLSGSSKTGVWVVLPRVAMERNVWCSIGGCAAKLVVSTEDTLAEWCNIRDMSYVPRQIRRYTDQGLIWLFRSSATIWLSWALVLTAEVPIYRIERLRA